MVELASLNMVELASLNMVKLPSLNMVERASLIMKDQTYNTTCTLVCKNYERNLKKLQFTTQRFDTPV